MRAGAGDPLRDRRGCNERPDDEPQAAGRSQSERGVALSAACHLVPPPRRDRRMGGWCAHSHGGRARRGVWRGAADHPPGARSARTRWHHSALPGQRHVRAQAAPAGYEGAGMLAPRYRHLRRRHSRDGEAFLLAEVYIEEEINKRIPAKEFSTKTALRLIADLRGFEIGAAKQTLTIGTADIETSALLGISLNAPVAHIRRVVLDRDGIVVVISDGTYRGDVVKVDMTLKAPREG